MRAIFQLDVPDADVFEFEKSLASRLANPSSVLQAVGGGRYLLPAHVAKEAFPGRGSAAIRKSLAQEGATQVRLLESDTGVARIAARAEPQFVPRFMAEAPAAAPGDVDWHLKEVRLPDAWTKLGGVDNPVWASIRVGHIDTGFTEQPALGPWSNGTSAIVRTDLDANFFDSAGEDPLSALEPDHGDGFPYHGTRTLCALAGRDANAPTNAFFGAAPGVEVVPIRDTNSILVDDQQPGVCAAIRHAVESGCRVITMSQGITLLPMKCVQDALDEAYAQGVIVVAAAGQYLPGVVAPARLKRSIAVAGTTPGLVPWAVSCAGPSVDICAPAEPIRVASASFESGGYRYFYAQSNGTSYATPLVAGTAALWLARWGTELDTRYPQRWQRVEAFKRVLRASAQVPVGWDTQRYGAGVLDAAAAIDTALPDASSLTPE